MTVDNFSSLRRQIKQGVVLTPGDEGYEQSIVRWSYAAIRRARIVVQPADKHEVSAAVKYATEHNIALVVAGGRHATSGSSSIEGGMVIDLRRMNQVVVDPEAMVATYGGGCIWKDVDDACAPYNLGTVGGTVNHTGVGGLVLGGGLGWLTSKYGLAIDNLLEAEVVLADGTIAEASETKNKDLFWALRGAGQNFGVVTSFTSKLYPVGDVWSGPIVFSLDKMAQIVDFANYFHENNTGNESLWIGVVGGMPGAPFPCIFCMVFYDGSQEDAEKFFKPLLDVGPLVSLAKAMPYRDANIQVPNREEETRRLQGGASIVMPLEQLLLTDLLGLLEPFWKEKNIGEGCGVMFELLPHKKVNEVSNTAMAYAARGEYYHAATIFTWEDEALDQDIRLFNRKVVKFLKDRGYKGKNAVAQYNNYDSK